MTHSTQASPWPQYPEVPLFLDASRERSAPPSYRTSQAALFNNTHNLPHGLEAAEPTSHPRSDTTFPTLDEKVKSSPSFAHWVEKKAWQGNASENVLVSWSLEILSWIISALCIGTIIGILAFLQNKKVPAWPVNMTINMLSRTATGALILPVSEALGQLKWNWFRNSKTVWDFEVFDHASRGPWGSLLLLIRTKGRTLAALGAAVTVLSLALDPFFQQLVDFPQRWILQGTSTIQVVTQYQPKFLDLFNQGVKAAQQDRSLLVAAERYFYDNGTQNLLFGNSTRAEVPFACPTSNCTWPPYQTLGVCSSCVDVSQLLTFACLSTKMDWVTSLTGSFDQFEYSNATMCGYFFNPPAGPPILMSGYSVNPFTSRFGNASAGEVLLTRNQPLINNPTKVPLVADGSINFKNIRHKILDGLIVSAVGGPDSVFRNETPIAYECMLAWCVKTIKSSYYQAKYEEDVVSSLLNTTTDGGTLPYSADEEGFWFNGSIIIQANSTNNGVVDYGANETTAVSTNNVFDDIFPSFYTMTNSSVPPRLRFRTNMRNASLTRRLEFNPWMAPNNISYHMARIATAMTNVMRSSSSSEGLAGHAFDKETYVSVRWTWLTLPLLILILTSVFLVATIYKTSKDKNQVGLWKTSAVATLLYGQSDDMKTQHASPLQSSALKWKVKDKSTRFLPQHGWRNLGSHSDSTQPHISQSGPPPGWI